MIRVWSLFMAWVAAVGIGYIVIHTAVRAWDTGDVGYWVIAVVLAMIAAALARAGWREFRP